MMGALTVADECRRRRRSGMRVRDIMTQPIVIVVAADTVVEAAVIMSRQRVGALAVCESNQLIGIVTDGDLVRRCLAASRPPSTTHLRDVMTRHPIVLSPSATLEEAARTIGEHGLRRLPVVENGRPIGMLSADDIARFSPDDEALAYMERALATYMNPPSLSH
jgi:CBS domain-containing protein